MSINRQTFLSAFTESVSEPAGSVKLDDELSQLESWDSLSVMSLITDIDVEHDVVLDPQRLLECTTVESIAVLVDSMIASGPDEAAA